jgi:hypothetical protein
VEKFKRQGLSEQFTYDECIEGNVKQGVSSVLRQEVQKFLVPCFASVRHV